MIVMSHCKILNYKDKDINLPNCKHSDKSSLFCVLYREPFSFDEFLNNKFSAKYFSGSWWSNNELLIKDESGNLVTWNVVDQTCKYLEMCCLIRIL